MAVELDPEARAKLAADYDGCLCPSCLRESPVSELCAARPT
jgi:hypothetical protein